MAGPFRAVKDTRRTPFPVWTVVGLALGFALGWILLFAVLPHLLFGH